MPRFCNKVFNKRKQVGKPKAVFVDRDCVRSLESRPSTQSPEPRTSAPSTIPPEPQKERLSTKKISSCLADYNKYKEM
ncbi:hypothetical protein J6590_078060 [Homalodisca vitripennis]|nr:hypothetical protein J6590_078060 [Homalodisca vitripennis]